MDALTTGNFSTNTALIYNDQFRSWQVFTDPIRTVSATAVPDVMQCLEEVERAAHDGYYAVGFLSYEAAPAFDSIYQVVEASDFPLAWFGIFRAPQTVALPPLPAIQLGPLPWQSSVSEPDYRTALQTIRAHIAAGDTYQVNYTMRLFAELTISPWLLFQQMIHSQGHGYGAYLVLPDWIIASASPELLFEKTGTVITCKPMKGTSPRHTRLAPDLETATALHHSPKNRAENLMITDMVRHDLSRVCTPGSVRVTRLCDVEQYPTVWQMTSTVQGTTDRTHAEILAALFPGSSITGAPKGRTMQIIANEEKIPRHLYTGSIGFLTPEGNAQFNIAIRTLLMNRTTHLAEYGTGGGIIWDSQPTHELEECMIKAHVLTHPIPQFDLIESMLYKPGTGYFLLEAHLKRLDDSARYFNYPLDLIAARHALETLAKPLTASHKVRLLLQKDGTLTTTSEPITPLPYPYYLGISEQAVKRSDRFLYHKTTLQPLHHLLPLGYTDCLFFNEDGELTESSRANVILEIDQIRYTPPVDSGLLAGTYRQQLLATGAIHERILTRADLDTASRIFLINSVRTQWEPTLVRTNTNIQSTVSQLKEETR